MKKFILVGLALLLSASILKTIRAQEYPRIEQRSRSPFRVPQEQLNYFWDGRTQLCFASATFVGAYGYYTTTFTNVPCTDKVWEVINQGRK